MPTQTDLEVLLRPYAEHPCPHVALRRIVPHDGISCWCGATANWHESEEATIARLHPTGLNPRFDALRDLVIYTQLSCAHCGTPHQDVGDLATDPHKTHLCGKCHRLFPSPEGYARSVGIATGRATVRTYVLRTDLGSIVQAAAACGLVVRIYPLLTNPGQYLAWVHPVPSAESEDDWVRKAISDNPEEAVALAFVPAVPLPSGVPITSTTDTADVSGPSE